MERSKPRSGLLLKAMALRAPSFRSVVGSGGSSARSASEPQPSSKASRAVVSNRTGGLVTAPRPLRGPGRMDASLCEKPSGMSRSLCVPATLAVAEAPCQEQKMERSVKMPAGRGDGTKPDHRRARPWTPPASLGATLDACGGGGGRGGAGGGRRQPGRDARRRPGPGRAGAGERRRGGAGNSRSAPAAARGEWLLFLHADTRPAPGWAGAARDFHGGAGRGGARGVFRLRPGRPVAGGAAAGAAGGVALPRAWRLPYGDQGLLISRALYDAVGGFRPLPLMEDVDLVRRLGRPAARRRCRFRP